MAWRCLLRVHLILLFLHHNLLVSATTTVYFYTDASCNDLYATVQTDTNAGNGQCGEVAAGVNSAKSGDIDGGCSGIYLPRIFASCCLLAFLLLIGVLTGTDYYGHYSSHHLHGRLQQQRHTRVFGCLYGHEHCRIQRRLSSDQRHV